MFYHLNGVPSCRRPLQLNGVSADLKHLKYTYVSYQIMNYSYEINFL
jgi:hypothetical protein